VSTPRQRLTDRLREIVTAQPEFGDLDLVIEEIAADLIEATGLPGQIFDEQPQSSHRIEVRADGCIIMHPLSCRPNLFACPFNDAARESDDVSPGVYECSLAGDLAVVLVGARVLDGGPDAAERS
jgi:hypothetical protein